ncbi:MAG: UDP-2,4-diacetamido-2,4,6-trideoxy-beta-L-altropyranose hydrolase [Gammaproteobacteria bacterium]|nr:UDP-2,4-diacetamido-2,4,6-trideoxy-beta-L-altropyranose hydrolase [Gammaproteobacteria bacterium]
MKIVIRVDASLEMGTGHVMRCLTLAELLKENGAHVEFICRRHEGSLINKIRSNGFNVYELEVLEETEVSNKLVHSHWLGATQQQDANDCIDILKAVKADWLIVDHYGIDEDWQQDLEAHYEKLMVIDDLADRKHNCDLLLDQTYCREINDYKCLVPSRCQILVGSKYALLRPEFSEWREYSLKRRRNPEFKKLLITMGGVDKQNITEIVLEEIKNCDLPLGMQITVVMGGTAPHLDAVRQKIKSLPFEVEVKSNVVNMAELMANSDAAIGASGATTWERCCLGVPSIQIITAQNQAIIANYMDKAGAALSITIAQLNQLQHQIAILKRQMKDVITKSAEVTDGTGLIKILRYIK